ncbi:MAG: DUF1365 domain-containing protein [Sphingomicrobium sp.]
MRNSALYTGRVMHRRLRPRLHQLDYRIFSLLIDLDEIEAMDSRLRLFSRGRFNLLSFRDRDYGDGSATPLRAQAEAHLKRIGIADIARIELLTMPRLLGFAFNPLSNYFCYDRGGALTAIIHEVHNTFGERHSYVLTADEERGSVRQNVAKAFHVSPFLPMKLDYTFRVHPPGEKLRVAIQVSDKDGPLLVAVQHMERRILTDAAILRAALAFPLMTVTVVAGILWEAAKLWVKGVAVHRHPAPPEASASYGPASAAPEQAKAA